MSRTLTLGFSPCPNDTFIFHAMTNGLINTEGLSFNCTIKDVQELNSLALKSELQVTKLSFYAWLKLMDRYDILDSGSALGFGCGPLVVAKNSGIDLSGARVAIPGELTTANLLFSLWHEKPWTPVYTRFDRIMPGILDGTYDAGVIIHEGRFVFSNMGLEKIIDLGQWWEEKTNLPIPLGCIAVRKDPDTLHHREKVEKLTRKSIEFARQNPEASENFIKSHSQELSDEVIKNHIGLYVNEFSLSLGERGMKTVEVLKEEAMRKGLL